MCAVGKQSDRLRLLVAEDDAAFGALLQEFLELEGYAVTLVTSVDAAVATLRTRSFDLVLGNTFTTLGTGGLGMRWAALERIQAAAGTTPVIIMTGFPGRAFADWQARGFQALLLKPFNLVDLASAIRRALAAPSP